MHVHSAQITPRFVRNVLGCLRSPIVYRCLTVGHLGSLQVQLWALRSMCIECAMRMQCVWIWQFFASGPTSTYKWQDNKLYPGFRINNPKTGVTLAEYEDRYFSWGEARRQKCEHSLHWILKINESMPHNATIWQKHQIFGPWKHPLISNTSCWMIMPNHTSIIPLHLAN